LIFTILDKRYSSHHSMSHSAIVQKLWNDCNALRDDGMSYGHYVEQLTYLLFLKMADQRTGFVRLVPVL
jgi:type I restriction-modification system DNA methylase subunit